MNIELISYTPNAEKIVASAARLCYSKSNIGDLIQSIEKEDTKDYIERLFNMGHESPFEHVTYTFGAEGVSRVLTHQLVRHRIGSYSQQSQRYVRLDQFEYIIPPSINKNNKARELFIETMERDQKAYDELIDIILTENIKDFCRKTSENFINEDTLLEDFKVRHKKAYKDIEKSVIEDARYVFPNACETKIVFTMNARSLFNFFTLRCCNRAHWEIREMANKMLKLVREVSPNIFRFAGPSCVRGECTEGDMSCKRRNI